MLFTRQEKGWIVTKLNDIAIILDSKRIPINNNERRKRNNGKKQEELFPYYGATGQSGWIDDYIFDEEIILLGEDAVPFLDPLKSKAYIVNGKCWVNNHAHVLKGIKGLCDNRYLTYYLNQYDYQGIVTGSTRLKLTQKSMRQIDIKLAPINEQYRIADKLDLTFKALKECKQSLNNVSRLVQLFRQSVLTSAVSGELTKEWRKKQGFEEEWKDILLGDIAEIQGGIMKNSKKELAEFPEVPYLRVANVQRGFLSLDSITYIRAEPKKAKKLLLQPNDILFNEGGDRDKIGRGWIWEGQIENCIFQNHIFRARLYDQNNQAKFISHWANTKGLIHFLKKGKQTTLLPLPAMMKEKGNDKIVNEKTTTSKKKKAITTTDINVKSKTQQPTIDDFVNALLQHGN